MDPKQHLRPDSEPFHQVLERVAEDWGLESSRTHLIRDGLNHVYAAQGKDGRELVVRVSDGAHRTVPQIEGELLWLEHLSQGGCDVPTPVRNHQGELLDSFGQGDRDFHVAMFERLPGEMMIFARDKWTDPAFRRYFGQVIGRVHRVTDTMTWPEHLRRGHWYEEREVMMPDQPPEIFDPLAAGHMLEHQNYLRGFSATADPRHYGLCHRDAHGMNMLYADGKLSLLDFELGCRFWRVVDITVTLIHLYYMPISRMPDVTPKDATDFLRDVLEGYREEHDFDRAQLERFEDVLAIREILTYVLTVPDPAKWDRAVPDGQCTFTCQVKWFEERWQKGRPDYGMELDRL